MPIRAGMSRLINLPILITLYVMFFTNHFSSLFVSLAPLPLSNNPLSLPPMILDEKNGWYIIGSPTPLQNLHTVSLTLSHPHNLHSVCLHIYIVSTTYIYSSHVYNCDHVKYITWYFIICI